MGRCHEIFSEKLLGHEMFEYLGLWSVRSLTQVLLKTKSYKLVVGNYGNSNAKTTASGCDKWYSYSIITSNIQDFPILRFHVYTPTIFFLTNLSFLNTK